MSDKIEYEIIKDGYALLDRLEAIQLGNTSKETVLDVLGQLENDLNELMNRIMSVVIGQCNIGVNALLDFSIALQSLKKHDYDMVHKELTRGINCFHLYIISKDM